MNLPLRLTWDKASDRWASLLNPILGNPSANPVLLKDISLLTGTNVIPHRLGKALTGWQVCRQRGLASIYDSQDTNQTPGLTLVLVSSADVSIDLQVF